MYSIREPIFLMARIILVDDVHNLFLLFDRTKQIFIYHSSVVGLQAIITSNKFAHRCIRSTLRE